MGVLVQVRLYSLGMTKSLTVTPETKFGALFSASYARTLPVPVSLRQIGCWNAHKVEDIA